MAFLGTTPPSINRVDRYNPNQNQALDFLLNRGQQGFMNPGQGFQPIADNARNQFMQQTVPGLAERFASTGGALSSPGFAQQLGAAGAGLESNLASQQAQFGQNEISQLMQMLQLGIQPRTENFFQEEQPGFGSTAGAGLLGAMGSAAPMLAAAGPVGWGTAAGGTALALLLSLLGQQGSGQSPVERRF